MAEYLIDGGKLTALADAIRDKIGKPDRKMTPAQMATVVNNWNVVNAFAVYCDEDKSLTFYKQETVPRAGEHFYGKIASEVYTGIESSRYTNGSEVPWASKSTQIKIVTIMDYIRPISTAYWFYNFYNDPIIYNMQRLDTSYVVDMNSMFYHCTASNIDVSEFNTSRVKNMAYMFYYCDIYLPNVSGFDVSHVTNMKSMFDRSSIQKLDISNWDVSNVTNMDNMFYACDFLQKISLGDKFHWVGDKSYLPITKSSNSPTADGKWYAESNGVGYNPPSIPSNKADTYYASKRDMG